MPSSIHDVNLKQLVAAVSYQRDDRLREKGLDPEKLRAIYYKSLESESHYMFVDELGGVPNLDAEEKYRQELRDRFPDAVLITINISDAGNPDDWMSRMETYNHVFAVIARFDQILNVDVFQLQSDHDDNLETEEWDIETLEKKCSIPLEEIIRKFPAAIQQLGEVFGYDVVIRSV
jgi:hypothetical protein